MRGLGPCRISAVCSRGPGGRGPRRSRRTRAGGQTALITEASNQSPVGGREVDWIVTTVRPDDTVYYFIGVAPQNDFDRYLPVFQDIIDSVRFK